MSLLYPARRYPRFNQLGNGEFAPSSHAWPWAYSACTTGPLQLRHVHLDLEAQLGLQIRQVAIALGKGLQQLFIEHQFGAVIERVDAVFFRKSAGGARSARGCRVPRKNRKAPGADHVHRDAVSRPRWLMVILVCAIARWPLMSTAVPPRKCRIDTPLSKPSFDTLMNSSADPWNQVALI